MFFVYMTITFLLIIILRILKKNVENNLLLYFFLFTVLYSSLNTVDRNRVYSYKDEIQYLLIF